MQYEIYGGKKLEGKIKISGNKNSVFPCIAAALLTKDEVILENVSDTLDTQVLLQILKELGINTKKEKSKISIKASQIKSTHLPESLMTKLRGSVVLAGALLARLGKVSFHHPGGDVIGQRSIDTHLEGFKSLGAEVKVKDLDYSVKLPEKKGEDCDIFLFEASVTALENLILATSLDERQVILRNCSKEPQIVDLCKILLAMGVSISGVGTDTLTIRGKSKLNGTQFTIGMDYIELGTYAIAACVTGGKITITDIDDTDLDPVLTPLQKFGVEVEKENNKITFSATKLKAIPKLTTNIWPGFPTDLMSAAIVLATQAQGVTLCHDWMYESRMFFVDKLINMGANIIIADPHRVFVYGPTKLRGRTLETPDIRAGMALVLAALIARGKSVINQAELIERGYEDVVGKLKALGADIESHNT